MYSEQMTQALSVADYVPQTNAAANTYLSSGVAMQNFHRLMYSIQVDAITGAGTLDANLQSCVNANFNSGVHNITGTNINQVTNANTNTVTTIEVRGDQVTYQNPGDKFVRLRTVVGTNAVGYSAVGWGDSAAHKPASDGDVAADVWQRLICNS